VIKHADAGHLRVKARKVDRAQLLVENDGRGFDVAHPAGDGHFGLRMLEDLVRDAGGEFEVESSPGTGSRVSVEVAT